MSLRETMTGVTLGCAAATVLAFALRRVVPVPMAVLVTLGTTTYHLVMRLLVGWTFDRRMHNEAQVDAPWFAEQPWEASLYRALRVKRWKRHMPTYDPEAFDPSRRTWLQIAQAMCQAELVHEVIALLSFLPLVVCLACGDMVDVPVFAVTSLAAALFDLGFVVMQRYNRPRVLRIMRKRAGRPR